MSQQTRAVVQKQQKVAEASSISGSILQRAAVIPTITSVHSGILQRCSGGVECTACREKREGMIQRAAVNSAPTNAVPPIVHDVLSSSGQPLDAGTRSFMEPRFGHDFSGVRVHTDDRAAESARAVNALAYTVGRDVVFGTGQYAPGTSEGKRLMAHELTHVVQQGGNHDAVPIRLGAATDGREQEATTLSAGIMATVRGHSPLSVTETADLGTVQRVPAWAIAAGGAALVGAALWAWWANHCLSPLEPGMRTNTLRFRPWYYTHTGAPVPSRVWDGFGHCWVACAGTEKCGNATTAIVGKSREFWREHLGGGPHDSYKQDTNNQTLGRSFGSQGLDCYDACRNASIATSGGLDLSAPKSELWDPTHIPNTYPDI